MAVLIKGAEMPTCCAECWFKICEKTSATDENLYWYKDIYNCRYKPEEIEDGWIDTPEALDGRQPWCPLVEVPTPHGRLIDADALMDGWMHLRDAVKYGNKNAEQQRHSYSTMMMYEIANEIDDAPPIIEAEEET